jgi:hypothetical protein
MGVSLVCMPFSMQDAMLISTQAQACAESHILLARQHKPYMKFLKKLTTATAYGAMISAHMPIVLGILANHNMMPDFSTLLSRRKDKEEKQDGNEPANAPTGLFYRPAI